MKPFRIERLAKQDRSAFDCGNESLNRYLTRTANQDQRKRYAACFLTIEKASETIAGYYTISAGSVDLDRLSDDLAKRMPRYPVVPVVQIGRLAVEQSFQRQGIAKWMLIDAYRRVQGMAIGAFALSVEAIDDDAEAFYLHYGFTRLERRDESERMLILPISNATE